MLHKVKKFSALSKEEKKLFLEAYVILGMTRAEILSTSFKQLTRTLKHTTKPIVIPQLNKVQIDTARMIGKAIMRASSATPWESACLAQSLTAQKMLKKRGIPGVFYLGVMKENEIKVHAWSQCGEYIITGEGGHEAFSILSVFEWKI